MTIEYLGRIPTVDYGYVEIKASDWNEFVEGYVNVNDQIVPEKADATDQAIKNLQNGGVADNLPGARAESSNRSYGSQNNGAPTCDHGLPRIRKTGTNDKGPYGGWVCQKPRADACKAIWD